MVLLQDNNGYTIKLNFFIFEKVHLNDSPYTTKRQAYTSGYKNKRLQKLYNKPDIIIKILLMKSVNQEHYIMEKWRELVMAVIVLNDPLN